MEDTLGAQTLRTSTRQPSVLILVLMEDTLGERIIIIEPDGRVGLNSCFNGRYSRRAKTYISLFIAV